VARILIIDDEPGVCWALRKALEEAEHSVETAGTAEQGLPLVGDHDLIFLDIALPGMDGLQALEQVRGVPVVQTLHNYRLLCANGLFLREGAPCEACVARGPFHAVRHGCYRGSRLQTLVWSDATAYHRRRGTWRSRSPHASR